MKKTMTLNLTDAKTAVIRQALRLYQTVEARIEKGDKLLFENDATKEKAELMIL
jgi:uncharacterized lipoprotein YbaY